MVKKSAQELPNELISAENLSGEHNLAVSPEPGSLSIPRQISATVSSPVKKDYMWPKIITLLLTILNIALIITLWLQVRRHGINLSTFFWSRPTPIVSVTPTPLTASITPTTSVPTPVKIQSQLYSNFARSRAELGLSIVRFLAVENPDTNVLISPLGISNPLVMAYLAASGSTREDTARLLKVTDGDPLAVATDSASILQSLSRIDTGVSMKIYNSLWISKQTSLTDEYLKNLKDEYDAHIQFLDISAPAPIDPIRAWLNSVTSKQIGDIESLKAPIPNGLMFINTAVLESVWTRAFDPQYTTLRDFFRSDGTTAQIQFMRSQRSDFAYQESPTQQIIGLPIGRKQRLGLYIYLPKDDALPLSNSLDIETIYNTPLSLKSTRGTLYLPKLDLRFTSSLKHVIAQAGSSDLFTNRADLSGGGENIFVDNIYHASQLYMAEKGVGEAWENEEFVITQQPKDGSFYMEVNQPFWLTVIDTLTGEILFVGAVNNPVSD